MVQLSSNDALSYANHVLYSTYIINETTEISFRLFGKKHIPCTSFDMIHFLCQIEVYGSVAYVSQSAWIQSGTIRENILFGKPFDRERYEKAIKACALDKDIENFANGDATEIGQRGLNMSGGQKQRIQLARAVYNDADVYLLDDPFSAVDAHTAATLFYVSL
jgi:ABC-type transport system involved in cytochrome bd biosynthesis fused ATPase/permease subunit